MFSPSLTHYLAEIPCTGYKQHDGTIDAVSDNGFHQSNEYLQWNVCVVQHCNKWFPVYNFFQDRVSFMSLIVMNPENQKPFDVHESLATGEKETALDAAAVDAQPHIAPQRERNFVVRPGFAYYLVTITFSEGLKFGLCVKHYRNQVIVSKVEEGSLAAESLKVMDRIVDVNSMPVTDKDVCKTLIVNALTRAGVVTMIVERPVDAAAIEIMENALSASIEQPPSVAMASDVKSIVRRYTEKLKCGHGERKPVKILLEPGSTGKVYGHVKIPDTDHHEMLIGMDHEDKIQRLQKVPSKSSSRTPRRKRKARKKW